MTLIRWTMLILLTARIATPDLNVEVPPGTPLDWAGALPRPPVPTQSPMSVPTESPPRRAPGGTVAEEPAHKKVRPIPYAGYGTVNVYDTLAITTADFPGHVNPIIPDDANPKPDGSVATGDPGALPWPYPPAMPMELYWQGCCAAIRAELHPKDVSASESMAFCLRLGVPALYGARGGVGGPVVDYAKKLVVSIPKDRPAVPEGRTPRETMICRLAAIELTGSYAYAFDPTFARRTLSFGAEAYHPLLLCARSPHSLLAQNAVTLLAGFDGPEVNDHLREISTKSTDPIVRIRALSALGERRDLPAVSLFVDLLESPDPAFRALAFHSLGRIGDSRSGARVRDLVAKSPKDLDTLWGGVPALARIADGDPKTLALLRGLKDLGSPGLDDMIEIALATNGDAVAAQKVRLRLRSSGEGGFQQAAWFLLPDAAQRLGMRDTADLVKFIEAKVVPVLLRARMLRLLDDAPTPDVAYFGATCDKGDPLLQVVALQLLARRDDRMARRVCENVLARYAGSMATTSSGDAYFTTAAVELGSLMGIRWNGALPAALLRARDTGAFAWREAKAEKDVTAIFKLHPPLLERLCLEAYRVGEKRCVEALLGVLKWKIRESRPEAAIALGAFNEGRVAKALAEALNDGDAWLRACAARSLLRLSGKEIECDWLFGSGAERAKGAASWKEWADKQK